MIRYFLILSLLLTACQRREGTPGLCLSFDDRYVKEWYSLRPLFDKYQAKVTFFITQPDSLTDEEVKMLRELERDGHEIGFHGTMHVYSENYIRENSYEAYYKNEIDTGVDSLRTKGFNPVSFAYPYGSKYWFTDSGLLKRFTILRSVSVDIDDAYYNFDNDRSVSAIGIDQGSGMTRDLVTTAIKRASEERSALLLYGHVPETEFLEFILKTSQEHSLNFYRFDQLPD